MNVNPPPSKRTYVSDIWQDGVRVVTVDPGNMTRYVIVLAKIPEESLGALGCDPGSYLVAIPNHERAHTFILQPDEVMATYVHEKLGLSWGDAMALTPILNDLIRNLGAEHGNA